MSRLTFLRAVKRLPRDKDSKEEGRRKRRMRQEGRGKQLAAERDMEGRGRKRRRAKETGSMWQRSGCGERKRIGGGCVETETCGGRRRMGGGEGGTVFVQGLLML